MSSPLSPELRNRLARRLERGLPRCARPYATLAEALGTREDLVLAQVRAWKAEGLFRRFGLIVHHRALGINANLMLVLDIPDSQVDAAGLALTREPAITLCYRRRRSLPQWPYNLFCMIHGTSRTAVQAQADAILQRHGLADRPHACLFSLRAFKQRGGRYAPPGPDKETGMPDREVPPEFPPGAPEQETSLDTMDRLILNRLQRGLPLVRHPWEALGAELGLDPDRIRARLEDWLADGTLTRFGPMFDIEPLGGAFTLAALSAPEDRFDAVAGQLRAMPEVAHNYRREHFWNMWFVLACESPGHLDRTLTAIESVTGLAVLNLPKEETYHVGLHLPL
ncbi:siroheme decarboxylase subunit beta [Castellaniella sp. WN]